MGGDLPCLQRGVLLPFLLRALVDASSIMLILPFGQKCAYSAASPLKNTNTSFGLCFCNLSLRTCMVAGMSVKLQYRLSSPVESDLRRCVHVVHRCAKRGGLQRGYPPCYVFFGATISFAYVKEMVANPAALRSRRQNTLLPIGRKKRATSLKSPKILSIIEIRRIRFNIDFRGEI